MMTTKPFSDEYMTIKEVAEHFKTSRTSVYRMIDAKELISYPDEHGRHRFLREDVMGKAAPAGNKADEPIRAKRSTRSQRPNAESSHGEIRRYAEADNSRWPLSENDYRAFEVMAFFSPRQAGQFMGVTSDVIYDLVDLGVLRPFFTPDGPRIRKSDLLALTWTDEIEDELWARRSSRSALAAAEKRERAEHTEEGGDDEDEFAAQ